MIIMILFLFLFFFSLSYKSGTSEVIVVTGEKELGKLTKIDISADALFDSWFLISLSVTHMASGEEYAFLLDDIKL